MATKTEIAIRLLKENATKSLDQVIPLIMAACDLSEKNANACYRIRIKADPSLALAAGVIKSKSVKTVTLSNIIKKVNKEFKKEVKAEDLLPDSEVAKIKAANLERLKQVTAKVKKYNQVALPEGDGVPNFGPDEARAEVTGLIESLDSFAAPRFLSKDQVRALV